MTTFGLSGGENLERKLEELANRVATGATLRVGFLEGATYPDGTPVATIAVINNFGAPEKGIPARPFFSKFIADNSDKWGEQLSTLLQHTNFDVPRALALMGEGMAGQLRQTIVGMNDPPNSPVTNLLKQRFPTGDVTFQDVLDAWRDVAAGETAPAGKPLVWSGNMLNSVDYEVVGG